MSELSPCVNTIPLVVTVRSTHQPVDAGLVDPALLSQRPDMHFASPVIQLGDAQCRSMPTSAGRVDARAVGAWKLKK